ncbi:MAG: hypothetical protein J7L86_04940, partial [Candidatus Marinimicrobia bacterium]|nr:hypothetical protein [Candidatus Neomarinimicrobiota bacterium]
MKGVWRNINYKKIMVFVIAFLFIATSFQLPQKYKERLTDISQKALAVSINDTDGDGLTDMEELNGTAVRNGTIYTFHPTDPNDADSDNDELTDGIEVFTYQTDPTRWSTDGDAYSDKQEIFNINMPAIVQSPGNNVFVAAHPELRVDISDEVNIELHHEITYQEGTISIQGFSYSVSETSGIISTTGEIEGHTYCNWVDALNKAVDQANYPPPKDISSNSDKYAESHIIGVQQFSEEGETDTVNPGQEDYAFVDSTTGYFNSLSSKSATSAYQPDFFSIKNEIKPFKIDDITLDTLYKKKIVNPQTGRDYYYDYSDYIDEISIRMEAKYKYHVILTSLAESLLSSAGIARLSVAGSVGGSAIEAYLCYLDEKNQLELNLLKQELENAEQNYNGDKENLKVYVYELNDFGEEVRAKLSGSLFGLLGPHSFQDFYDSFSDSSFKGDCTQSVDPFRLSILKKAWEIKEEIKELPSEIAIPEHPEIYEGISSEAYDMEAKASDDPAVYSAIADLGLSPNIGSYGPIKNSVSSGVFGSSDGVSVNNASVEKTPIYDSEERKGIGYESSFRTVVLNSKVKLSTVTQTNSILNGSFWSTATTVDTDDAGELQFNFSIKNDGTDKAGSSSGGGITHVRFNIYIGNTTPITDPSLEDAPDGLSFPWLQPGESSDEYYASVTLSLEQIRQIDKGAPIRIELLDYTYDNEEDYVNAWYQDVLFEVDDGTGNLKPYMVYVKNNDTYVDAWNRASSCPYNPIDLDPIVIGNDSIVSINGLPITNNSWWEVHLQNYSNAHKFQNARAVPHTKVTMVYWRDSDGDNYPDRTERSIGTDPYNVSSHPTPLLTAGAVFTQDGSNVTVRMVFQNEGNYDAYNVEARLYSPDNTTSIQNGLIGGGGRVKAGEK